MTDQNEIRKVFDELKSIFKPYARKMDVVSDTETQYWLNTRFIMKNKHPLAFGGVRLGKNYVSFHLMSLYASPDLWRNTSPELKKRMQGKSCFNFKQVDKELFSELRALTKDGAAKFGDRKFMQTLRGIQEAS